MCSPDLCSEWFKVSLHSAVFLEELATRSCLLAVIQQRTSRVLQGPAYTGAVGCRSMEPAWTETIPGNPGTADKNNYMMVTNAESLWVFGTENWGTRIMAQQMHTEKLWISEFFCRHLRKEGKVARQEILYLKKKANPKSFHELPTIFLLILSPCSPCLPCTYATLKVLPIFPDLSPPCPKHKAFAHI